MNLPLQSITRARAGLIFWPIPAMRSPSILTSVFVDGSRTSFRAGSISVAPVSVLSFHQSRCFAIDCGIIGVTRSQIKFVDSNLEKRRSRHGKNHPEKPEHCPGRKCEEQDVDRVQSHLFAEHARNKEV